MGPNKFLVLEFHVQDIYMSDKTNAMALSYGVKGTPQVYFDGSNPALGGFGAAQEDYNRYKLMISIESMQPSPVAITAVESSGGNSLVLNVQITDISSQAMSGARVNAITYLDWGTSQYRAIVNDVSSSTTVSLSPGQTGNYQITLPKPARFVQAVVLLTSGENVVQAALVS